MKVATLSTVFDYINRAMPWTAPKSLSTDEVYAVTAFLLNLSGVVPDDFTLSDKNIADVQKRMPNRNGMTTQHAMWPGKEFNGVKAPDVKNVACMKDCATEPSVGSFLPDFARNAHGNLAEQNRMIGPQRGADTTVPEGKAPAKVVESAKPAAASGGADAKAAIALLTKHSCVACHGVDKKIVGPGFNEVAKKHAGKADYLASKIKSGGSGVWGPIPMPAQALPEADARVIAAWIAAGAAK
jgi:cytochrome c